MHNSSEKINLDLGKTPISSLKEAFPKSNKLSTNEGKENIEIKELQ